MKSELNDTLNNENLSFASVPMNNPKYTYLNYLNPLQNNNYSNYNNNKDTRNVKEKEKENISNSPKELNVITINRSKNYETKSHLLKPKIKNEYPSNFNITSSGQKENKKINPKTDSNKKENINKRISINIKPL